MVGLSRRGGGASRGGGGDGGSRDGPGGSVTLGTRVGAAGSGMVAVSWDAANAFGAAPAIAAGCAVGWGWGWAAAGNDCRARLRQLVEGCARHVRERQLARWNLLWLAMIAGMALMPYWLKPETLRYCVLAYWLQVAFLYAFAAAQSICTLRRVAAAMETVSYEQDYPDTAQARELRHIVLMCAYKEPVELLAKTVQTVAESTVAKRIVMVVGFEEGTPDFLQKERALRIRFGHRFDQMIVTRHPRGIPGEIPGKCSNSNFAMRQVVSHLQQSARDTFDASRFTVTTCDADSCFDPRYFEALGLQFLTHERAAEVVWQAPLFYNYGLAEAAFFTRCTAILRSFFMMGFLIPCSKCPSHFRPGMPIHDVLLADCVSSCCADINTMSIFSFSLELCLAAGYMHPGYQMDDIIYTLSCMRATRRRVTVEPIYLPTLSGPTSGDTLAEEASEWQRQAKRWSIGAAEVFHYFVQSLIEGQFETRSGLTYCAWYTWYYAHILIGGPLFGVFSHSCLHGRAISKVLSWMRSEDSMVVDSDDDGDLTSGTNNIVLGCVLGQYMLFGVAHMIDAWFTHMTRHKSAVAVDPPIPLSRRFLHWLVTGPTLLCYSLVGFYGVFQIALQGKAVCTHVPSKKESLSNTLASSHTMLPPGEFGAGKWEGDHVGLSDGGEDGSSEDGSEGG